MVTKRQAIESLRKKLQERSEDSDYTNQDLYKALLEQSQWIIKREISAGRIYSNNSLFQLLRCIEVIEVPTSDSCCPVKTNCKIYRTKNKIPNIWNDNNGPVIKTVTSVDDTSDFFVTSPTNWQNKRNDPYQQMLKTMYSFPADGYIWIPENNPHFVNIRGFFMDDISLYQDMCGNCDGKPKECVRFLDTSFMVPEWCEAEIYAKALELLLPSKKMPMDEEINKNSTRK